MHWTRTNVHVVERISRLLLSLGLAAGLVLNSSCSIRKFAISKLGDALASGGSVYESDDDIDLVGQASPFALKLIESLLAEVPEHRGLLLAACRGFTTYTYVYVHQPAERIYAQDLDQGKLWMARARRLYSRARDYGLRGLEVNRPGIRDHLSAKPWEAVAALELKDVPLLYWNAAALGLAISVSRGDAEMLAHLPVVEALLARALALDETWQQGALHEFWVLFEGARPDVRPLDRSLMEEHYRRALDLSEGKRASLFLAYAETVSVRTQNVDEFRSLIQEALRIDPDAHQEIRLANLVAQHRARWLLGRIDELFLDPGGADHTEGGPQ